MELHTFSGAELETNLVKTFPSSQQALMPPTHLPKDDTSLMFPRAKGVHFGLPLLAFRVCSQVLPNRHEEFVLLQLKVKAQNTSAVQTENWEKNLQEVIKHL